MSFKKKKVFHQKRILRWILFFFWLDEVVGGVFQDEGAFREKLDRLCCRNVHGILFILFEAVENVGFEGFVGRWRVDAESDAPECLSADMLNDGFHAVVTTCGAVGANADGAERECDVVGDDDEILGFEVEEIEGLTNGFTRCVHVGGWFDQDELASVDVSFSDDGAMSDIQLPRKTQLLCQHVDDDKPGVVTGAFVVFSWVAQADDECRVSLHRWCAIFGLRKRGYELAFR